MRRAAHDRPCRRCLPLRYRTATQKEGEAVSFPVEGIEMGSLSMLSVCIGAC